MKIAIIGGGASGLMCGAVLAENNVTAVVFDGNEKLGKKIYITGKGRCNLTNKCQPDEFLENVVNGQRFMRGAINRFSSLNCINFFEEHGLKLKTERGNRVFPESDKASDVIKVLTKLNSKNQICLNEKIQEIKLDENKYVVRTDKNKYNFDAVVIATGGKSYSLTGSSGDGLEIAKKLGHKIVEPKPALVALQLKDKFVKEIQGLSLKNVTLHAEFENVKQQKTKLQLQGEMMFTDVGITGPIVLSMSSKINRAENIKLFIDFKPALSKEQLDLRLLRDFQENKNKNISYIIHGLLPKKLASVFLNRIEISENKKVHEITKEERNKIISCLKEFDLMYKNLYPLESGIVTSGGVELTEINPKSCESKLHSNLYFIGEVLDVDCLTGGFNLQTAFSTAYVCAIDLVNKIIKE